MLKLKHIYLRYKDDLRNVFVKLNHLQTLWQRPVLLLHNVLDHEPLLLKLYFQCNGQVLVMIGFTLQLSFHNPGQQISSKSNNQICFPRTS